MYNIRTRLNQNVRIYRLNLFHVNVKRKNKYLYNILSLSTSLADNLQSVRVNADCVRIMHVIIHNIIICTYRGETTPVIRDGVNGCRNTNAVGARVVAERGVYRAYIIVIIIYYYVYNVMGRAMCVCVFFLLSNGERKTLLQRGPRADLRFFFYDAYTASSSINGNGTFYFCTGCSKSKIIIIYHTP